VGVKKRKEREEKKSIRSYEVWGEPLPLLLRRPESIGKNNPENSI